MLSKRSNFISICGFSLTILVVTNRILKVTKSFYYPRFGKLSSYGNSQTSDVFRKDHFFNQWVKHETDRRAWLDLIKPCEYQTKWQDVLPWWQRDDRTDQDLSYITNWNILPAGEYSSLILQTQYKNGTIKKIGGDGWRVKVKGAAALQTFIRDLGDGSYEISFLPLIDGSYNLFIHLEYTLCDGMKDPPDDWFIRGNIQGKEQPHGILNNDMPYINKPLWRGSPIQFKVPPSRISSQADRKHIQEKACNNSVLNSKCSMLGNGFGQWQNGSWIPYCNQENGPTRSTLPKKRKLLWIFGDSVSAAFYRSIKTRPICKEVFRSCFYSYNWVYQLENYNHSMRSYVRRPPKIEKTLNDSSDFDSTRVITELSQVLQHPQMDDTSVVLLNYGLHYIESATFDQYKELISKLIKLLHTTSYKGTIIWRSTTSMSREKYSVPYLHSRRFLNSQRLELYNRYALETLCSVGMEILDVFPLTDSYPLGTGSLLSPYDPVHHESHVLLSIERLLTYRFSS